MDETQEQEVSTESNVETTQENTNQEAEQPQQQERTPGYNQIDFKTASPEEVEARFNRVFGQLKGNQRDLSEYRQIAAQQAKIIEDLQNGVGMVVNHLTDKTFREREEAAINDLQAAYEMGDARRIAAANANLTKIQNQQIAAENNKQQLKQQPKPQAAEPIHRGYQTASQMSDDALAEGDISPQEQSVLNAWSQETDERGGTLRPWIINSTGDPENPDPDYVKAWVVANQVFQNPNLSFNQKLAEIDKRMGVTKTTPGQTVLGGKFNSKPKSARITLSPDAEKLAVRTKFGGPKAKSDAEHIQAYREQLAKVQSSKGAR